MARRGRSIWFVAALTVASAVALVPASPASACSFIPPMVAIEGTPTAGGTLLISGNGWFTIDGEVDGMCQGDYTFRARTPVTVVVRWTTLSGPRSQAVTATVDTPDRQPDEFVDGDFTFAVQVPIPVDATAVTVDADGEGTATDTATIAGATATTVAPAATPPSTTPPAATPIVGTGSYTG